MTPQTIMSIPSLLLGLLLLAVPLYLFFRLDRRFLQRQLRALAASAVLLGVVGGVLVLLWRVDSSWLNVSWLLMTVATAVLTAVRPSHRVPVAVGVLVATPVVGILLLTVVLRLEHPFSASSFVPVMALLAAPAFYCTRRVLRDYAYDRRLHQCLYEYQLGNGIRRRDALRPFLRKSLTEAFLRLAGGAGWLYVLLLPPVLAVLLLCGCRPLTSVLLCAVLASGVLATSLLAALLAIALYEKRKKQKTTFHQ